MKQIWLGLVSAACTTFACAGDTHVSWRYGTQFSEPFNRQDIRKNILGLTHFEPYRYGNHFVSASLLLSDHHDPHGAGERRGAEELYVIYRHTLSYTKVSGAGLNLPGVRDVGLTAGFDVNRKHDVGYNSRKQMWVAGPTLMFEVPGYLNVSLLQMWESNAPSNDATGVEVDRYHYKPHPMLNALWGIPLGEDWSLTGYANLIAAKGRNEFGGKTAAETNIEASLLYDLGASIGLARNHLKIGPAYQYWKNKFGNDHDGPAGKGAFAKTPMLRVDYRF